MLERLLELDAQKREFLFAHQFLQTLEEPAFFFADVGRKALGETDNSALDSVRTSAAVKRSRSQR